VFILRYPVFEVLHFTITIHPQQMRIRKSGRAFCKQHISKNIRVPQKYGEASGNVLNCPHRMASKAKEYGHDYFIRGI
jgi:hypothetical protein